VTLTTPIWGQFVIKGLLRAGGKTPRSTRSVNTGPHSAIGEASNSLAPALAAL